MKSGRDTAGEFITRPKTFNAFNAQKKKKDKSIKAATRGEYGALSWKGGWREGVEGGGGAGEVENLLCAEKIKRRLLLWVSGCGVAVRFAVLFF